VKPDPTPSTALVPLRHAAAVDVWDDVRLQNLWLGVEKRGWRSLAVIGAGRSVETIHLAELLAQLAWRYRGQPSAVCDLRDLSMRLVDYQVREMQDQVESGVRTVVALRSIFENPTSAPVAKQTDGILMCIALGETTVKEAEETIAVVGRENVIGSIVLRPRRATKARSGGR
jgi:hypothetical protein